MSTQFNRRTALTFSTLAAGAIGLSACGSGNSSANNSAGAKVTGQTLRVWFMEGSISDAATKYLQSTFAEKNEGNNLVVEIQPWDGIVAKLQTSLASKSESPDLVETGNTMTAAFSTVGAFSAVDDMYDELGGSKLIQSFVEAGRYNGKLYSLPLYAGARGVFYRKDLFRKANIAEPKTLDEFTQAVIDLGKANPDNKPGFSGMYLAAVDQNAVGSLFFAGGGDWATQEGDKWVEKLSSAESVSSLQRIQRIFKEGTTYGLDSQASQKAFEKYFNEGLVGAVVGTGNIGVKIDKALWDADKVAVMPIPGLTEGVVGKTFAGGSHISIASNAKNPALAREALKIIFSEGFQKLVSADGWVPGNTEYGKETSGAFSKISGTVVENSKLTPNTPQWGVATGNNLVRDFWTALAQGADVNATAKDYGAQLATVLNSKQ